MKPTFIPAVEYTGNQPIIAFSSKFPKLDKVELPILRCKPVVLCTATGKIAEYLINYRPLISLDEQDNVTFTRHCFYVERETWQDIKKAYDKYVAEHPDEQVSDRRSVDE